MVNRSSVIFSLLLSCSSAYAVDSYLLNASSSQDITEHAECRAVTNSGSVTRMIPTKTSTEWQSFYNNPPPNTTIGSCGGGSCTPGSTTFSHTGADQTFNVPSGCTSLTIKMWGAGGGGGSVWQGAGAGFVQADLAVSGGQTLTVIVGGRGIGSASYVVDSGGFGGGGDGDANAGGGGGRSAIRNSGGTELLTAAGGGGGGRTAGGSSSIDQSGGPGGGTNGVRAGNGTNANSGYGGTQSAGGAGGNNGNAGTQFQGGDYIPDGACSLVHAGGGGGYYGGGSGGCSANNNGGGGGGSSYIGGAGVSNASTTTGAVPAAANDSDSDYSAGIGIGGGLNAPGGHGKVVISW